MKKRNSARLPGPPGAISLRVMATTDLHMHLAPFDYATDRPSDTVGLARTAALIRKARAEADNALLLDNGDFLHGNPMGDEILRGILRGKHEPRGRHPVMAAMRLLRYDAMTLGNHDFDHGVEYLGQVLHDAPFPVVVSNLSLLSRRPGRGPRPMPVEHPFVLLERKLTDRAGRAHKVTIGLLGFLPPGTITGLRGGPFRAEIRDIVPTARMMVPYLRGLGADVIVALAHSGIGPADDAPGLENAVVPLAAVRGIDVIVSGHAHQAFPGAGQSWPAAVDAARGRVHQTPVVAPGFWGSHLGVVDLELRRDRAGGWRVAASQTSLRAISGRDPATGRARPQIASDPAIERLLEKAHHITRERVARPVGQTRRRLHSYFATVAPSGALDVVHRAMAWRGKQAVAGTALADLPILASSAPFKAGGLAGPGFFTDIASGAITLRALTELYPFPNDLCGLRLSGAELAEWLERSASLFNRIRPGQGQQALFAKSAPAYAMELVAGCGFCLDLSAAPRYDRNGVLTDRSARRVHDIRIGGAPVRARDEVLLMTNSHRINGAGGYPIPDPARIEIDLPLCVRDVVADYLARTGPYDLAPWANWDFAPVPGASAQFFSSPRATEVLRDVRGIDAMEAHPHPSGFQAYRLAL